MPDPYDTANPPAQSNTEGTAPSAVPNPNPSDTGGDRGVNMYTPRGDARGFSRSTYDVENLSYPDDLFGLNGRNYNGTANEYGGNYVVFYINVHQDSKLFNDGTKDINGNDVQTVDPSQLPPRDVGQLRALGLNTTELVSTVGTQSTLVGGAAVLGGASPTAALSTAAVNTVGAGIVANSTSTASRQTRRLQTAIAMHVPNQLQIRYSAQYSDEDTAAFAMVQGVGGEIINAISSLGDNSDVTGAAGGAAANLFLSKSPNGAAVSAATGLAANPKKEQIFKGVDFRTFEFVYQFFPRSEKEARNVMNIIKQFKYHMHPEMKDARNFVYLYPSEFDIYYYKNGRENLNVHRHTSCVLTDMAINYTPNGVYSTFPNGMSTQINVAMTFKELSLMTKEKIMDGM